MQTETNTEINRSALMKSPDNNLATQLTQIIGGKIITQSVSNDSSLASSDRKNLQIQQLILPTKINPEFLQKNFKKFCAESFTSN